MRRLHAGHHRSAGVRGSDKVRGFEIRCGCSLAYLPSALAIVRLMIAVRLIHGLGRNRGKIGIRAPN